MTGSTIAYALRADHEADGPEPFGGGLIRLGEDRDLNIAEALDAGKGRIVVASTDHVAALALDAYTPLKRVPAGNAALTVTRWEAATATDLQAELKLRDLPVAGKKAELLERLVAHDAAVATGDATARGALAAPPNPPVAPADPPSVNPPTPPPVAPLTPAPPVKET